MSVMIQVRNVPDDVHRMLKARASEQGVSLSDFCLRELEHLARLPSMSEWVAQVRSRPSFHLSEDPGDVVRNAREDRWP